MKTSIKLALGLVATALSSTTFALTLDNTPFGSQTVPDNPQRIVLLDLASADDLLAFGEASRVVGIPKADYMPALFKDGYAKVASAGTLIAPDFEAIAKLKPDLIVASRRTLAKVDQLKEIAPVYINDIAYENAFGSVKTNILNWGKIVNKTAQAEQVVKELDEKVAKVNARIKDKTAIILLNRDRKISAYAPASRFGMIYAGGGFNFIPVDKNIKEDRHGQEVSFEYLVEKNPDFIFVVDRNAAITEVRDNFTKTFDNDYTKKLKAFQHQAIYPVNAANWYLAFGGIQVTKDVIKEVTEALDKATYK